VTRAAERDRTTKPPGEIGSPTRSEA
jgi:hypothetical protein